MPLVPDPKQAIELAFVEYLKAHSDFRDIPDGPDLIEVVPGANREVEVTKPYIVVVVDDYNERGDSRFQFAGHIILVSNMDKGNETRKSWSGKIWDRLREPVHFIYDDSIVIYGWSLPRPREISDGQDTGDSFDFTGGGAISG